MRERLTFSFVLLTVALLLGALLVRSYTTRGLLRDHETVDLHRQLAAAAVAVAERDASGSPVDGDFLGGLTGQDERVVYAVPGQPAVTAAGVDFDSTDRLSDGVDVGGGRLTLEESGAVVSRLAADDRGSIGLLVALVALLAALVGYVLARVLSAPFRQLAVAAEQLGRGRFDLGLPRTHIPEARAIGQALQVSAGQLQQRLTGEQAFAEHASHVLRTPLTGLRLELEDLSLRDDVPRDVRQAAARSLGRIDNIDVVAGELVRLSRRGSLIAGAEITVRDLASQCAQSWADALAIQDRPLSAAVEGDLEMTYTPGPVEHVLDLLLADVLERGNGAVRMVFGAADGDGHLRININTAAEARTSPDQGDLPVAQARAVVSALGGRLLGDNPHDGLEVLLPRR